MARKRTPNPQRGRGRGRGGHNIPYGHNAPFGPINDDSTSDPSSDELELDYYKTTEAEKRGTVPESPQATIVCLHFQKAQGNPLSGRTRTDDKWRRKCMREAHKLGQHAGNISTHVPCPLCRKAAKKDQKRQKDKKTATSEDQKPVGSLTQFPPKKDPPPPPPPPPPPGHAILV